MEQWKPIQGYPNYEISSDGRVKSLNYNRTGKEKILCPQTNAKGYRHVVLCNAGKTKTFTVYKLVALAYIPNPLQKPSVDHMNRNKTDDRVENLRWASYSEQNYNRAIRLPTSGNRHIHQHPNGKFFVQITKSGLTLYCETFDTLEEAVFARDAFLDAENVEPM